MENLIDSDVEETTCNTNSVWTEQALDSFISLLKNVKKENPQKDLQDLLPIVSTKMLERKFGFTYEQIERKYNSLKKMFANKMGQNEDIEPELIKLFGNEKSFPLKRINNQEGPTPKKAKPSSIEDESQKSNTSPQNVDENKKLWSGSSTRLFLELLEQLRPQLGEELGTKKEMWKEICRRMQQRGYTYTYSQVENKWKALLRVYRNRLDGMRSTSGNKSSFQPPVPNGKAWPELFELAMNVEREKSFDFDVSFANDAKLPFDDDGYDEEPLAFEEACSLPNVEVLSEVPDPVLIDVKPSKQQLKNAKSANSTKNPLELNDLDKLFTEIEQIRKDKKKQQSDLIAIKKQKLQAYKERTAQITRIGDGLNALVDYFKKKGGVL